MSPTKLDYAITTTPFPPIASPNSDGSNQATLNLVAFNFTSSPVSIQAIALTLCVGSDTTDLTVDASSIQPQAPTGWTVNPPQYANSAAEFSFSSNDPSGAATVASQSSLTFTLATITINQWPGPTNLVVTEGSDDCQPPNCPTEPFEVTKFPNDWSGAGSTVSFTANPPIITANDPSSTTTLSWSGPAGPTYSIEYATQAGSVIIPAKGQLPLGHTGEYPPDGSGLALAQSTTFYLIVAETVDEQPYSAQYPLPVTAIVPAPQVVSFTAVVQGSDPTQPTYVLLSWQTTNVSAIHIDGIGSFLGADALQGSTGAPLINSGIYTASAYGLTGYAGPPAFADAHIGYTGLENSGFLDVWQPTPTTLWTITVGQNQPVLMLVVDRIINFTKWQCWGAALGLVEGVEAVAIGSQVTYDELAQAPFAAPIGVGNGEGSVWIGCQHESSSNPIVQSAFNLGAGWGLKLPDGTLAAVWYQSATPQSAGNAAPYSWSFTFQWIVFGLPPS